MARTNLVLELPWCLCEQISTSRRDFQLEHVARAHVLDAFSTTNFDK